MELTRVRGGYSLQPILWVAPVLLAFPFLRSPESLEYFRTALLLWLLGWAAVSDLRHGTIPNWLNALGGVFALMPAVAGGTGRLGAALVGGVACGLALLGVRAFGYLMARQPGMGYGDVKLGAVVGLLLGWSGLWALYLGAVLAGVVGVVGITVGRIARRERIPFAPFIALGVVVHLFWLPAERVFSWLLWL